MPHSKSYNNNVSIYPNTNELDESNVPHDDNKESVISDKAQDFRLSRITQIQSVFESEAVKYEKLRRKTKVLFNSLNSLGTGAQATSIALATTTIGLTATGIGIPIAIPFAVTTIASGALATGINFALKKLTNKIEKYNKIEALANSKLSSVSHIISKALNDGDISAIENKQIEYERTQYIAEKSNIRKRFKSSRNIDEKGFLEKGRQQGLKEAEKKMRENLKIM